MSLTTITEDIPSGGKNWFQKIVDRWAAVNANFGVLAQRIVDLSGIAVKSVNGVTPTAGAVTIPTGKAVDIQVFTASGTWTMPTGAKAVHVLVMSGGAGGTAWAQNNTGISGPPNVYGAPGGGAHEALIPASALPSSVSVTVGAGGIGGTVAQTNTAGTRVAVGTAGGDSSFGGLVTAVGATPGTTNATTTHVAGAPGAPKGAAAVDAYHVGGTPNIPAPSDVLAAAGTSVRGGGAGGGVRIDTNTPYFAQLGGYGSEGDTPAAAKTTDPATAITGGAGVNRSGTGRSGSGGGAAAAKVGGERTGINTTGGAGGIPSGGGGSAGQWNGTNSTCGPTIGGAAARGEVIVTSYF